MLHNHNHPPGKSWLCNFNYNIIGRDCKEKKEKFLPPPQQQEDKAPAKLRLGIYYLRKSVFLIFLNNQHLLQNRTQINSI
jgi:hypothetical protein